MNLSTDKRTPAGDSGAGGGLGTVANAGPAHPEYTVGSIQFRNAQLPPDVADAVMEQMADSIVRLQFECDELRAEVALLRGEREIMAAEISGYRDEACRESCRDKEAADRMGGNPWSNR